MEITSQGSECTVDDCRMALKTVCLEKEYENALGRAARILDLEKTRVKRVEQLLLSFENENLRWQLDQVKQELAKTSSAEADAHRQRQEAWDELDRLRSNSHASSHETETLRRELALLSNTTFDSQKLAAENLRLLKDLTNLRSEVERLKSESSSYTHIAEKRQTLERQLSTLEQNLGDEKRAHELTLGREAQQAEEITVLTSRLEETRKELVEEVQARGHRERDAHQQSLEWTAQRTALESKLEDLDRKLRSKGHSQETQVGHQRQHGILKENEPGSTVARSRTIPIQRPAGRFNPELTIATPGAIKAQDKRKRASALPGDKSSFSITPFLNRANGVRNSPTSSEDDTDELNTTHVSYRAKGSSSGEIAGNDKNQNHIARAEKISQHREKQPLSPTTFDHKKYQKSLNKSDTEDPREGSTALFTNIHGHGQSKMKKRKLGAQRDRNLFDEGEDEDDVLQDVKKPGRKLVLGGTGNQLSLNRGLGAMTGFSPLKRDRKR